VLAQLPKIDHRELAFMRVLTTLPELRRARAGLTGSLGLVPARGALHAGKLSLVERARAECDHVAVSLMGKEAPVRADLERDLRLLEPLGVDLVWAPTHEAEYPTGFQSWVMVEHVSLPLEGKRRPGHFQGFSTLIAKLFNAFSPSRAYFGQIDAQRAAIVRRLVLDLDYELEIVVCPTVREPDGLAVSSRNPALNAQERPAATVLYRALAAGRQAYAAGERDGDVLRASLSSTLAAEPLAREEYVSVADPDSLDELQVVKQGALLSIAARIGKVRLLDSLSLV
jgi:pantoate--beta-alanine ligase